jgi:hypothetical protein
MPKNSLGTNVLQIDRITPLQELNFSFIYTSEPLEIVWEDERSLALTEIDLDSVQLVTMLKNGEGSISLEEKIRRIRECGHILLDLRVAHAIKSNSKMALRLLRKVKIKPKPIFWKPEPYVHFDGTIFCTRGKPPSCAAIHYSEGSGILFCNDYPLTIQEQSYSPSAVLIP